jgi:hypothetical protein
MGESLARAHAVVLTYNFAAVEASGSRSVDAASPLLWLLLEVNRT